MAGWVQRRYGVTLDPAHAAAAGERLARGAVCAGADGDRPDAARRHRGLPQPVLSDLRRCGAAGRRADRVRQQRPGAQLRSPTGTQIATDTWARTQLLYVCSPGNPTGAVMPLAEWRTLFELSDRHGFVIASDECYSEIYFRDEAAAGRAAGGQGAGPRRLPAPGRPFTSLSKRSNVPGMRSGFVAGDASILKHSCSTAPTMAAR